MQRKEETEKKGISFYPPNEQKRMFFAVGTGYLIGSAVGMGKGLVDSLRKSQARPNGMLYFVTSEAKEFGRAAALGTAVSFSALMALERAKGMLN
ncbi:hypothetical protein NEFER03_0959 [Nematocida sp. LUAm3]|nr:hypothetical protein NEFER03_0959 [Nematocida sp. LUAm3]KAI5175283.1 hypothetical protein NEFER02_1212 [Nematocida sp. LUAm2]KAI5177610.1 hypothetical protein NEFER01_0834 [Nematocida sp. LUAm1]